MHNFVVNTCGLNKQPLQATRNRQQRGTITTGKLGLQLLQVHLQDEKMQRPASHQQQPTQNASNFSSQKKGPSGTIYVVQNEADKKPSPQQPINSSTDPHRQTQQGLPLKDNLSDNNNTTGIFEDFRLYRGRGHEGFNEKPQLTENTFKSLSAPGTSAHTEKKILAVSSSNTYDSTPNSNSSDSSHATFLRHPRTNSSSSPTQKNPPAHLQVPQPNIHHHQSLSSQHQHQQLKQHQQMMQHQHQHVMQQPQILRDHSPQNENHRIHGQVIRVRSYPTELQNSPTALHATLQRQGNLGKPWSIPRVITSSSGRPHSLTIPIIRHHEGSHPSHTEFSNYNPSASPRALRSHSRIDSDNIIRQTSLSNSTRSPLAATNPPKSILKNNQNSEQPGMTLSFRPKTLPRAHSVDNQNSVARDFDFSSILNTNKDPFSVKTNTVKLTGQACASPAASTLSQSQRPSSISSTMTKYEGNQDGSARKSVTFNSLVRLHHDNQVSTVRSFQVDT